MVLYPIARVKLDRLRSLEFANWHPLTWLSHALHCQIDGLNAGAHHGTNLIIHILRGHELVRAG